MRGATKACIEGMRTGYNFYSHAPCGARQLVDPDTWEVVGISTHTPHAGRDAETGNNTGEIKISTHTPHAGRDVITSPYGAPANNFYSHAPCGARLFIAEMPHIQRLFLLTRPMRGATYSERQNRKNQGHFYSHAPCGARLSLTADSDGSFIISTHTPHAGRDVHW